MALMQPGFVLSLSMSLQALFPFIELRSPAIWLLESVDSERQDAILVQLAYSGTRYTQ